MPSSPLKPRLLALCLRDPSTTLTFTTVILVVMVLILYPATSLLIESIRAEDGGWTLARYQQFFGSTYFRHTLYNTLLIAGIAAFLAQILGFVFAYGVVRCAIPGRTIFSALVLLPMLLPAFLIAFALILLLGRNGLINRGLFTLGEWLSLADPSALQWVVFGSHGVILAQTLTFFPLAFLVYSAALTAMDPRLEEAARDMGASYWHTLTRVTLPLLAPAAFSSTLLVFMFNISSFGAPALLSGGRLFFPDATMLAPEAIIQILGMYDWGMGTTIAVILVVPSLLVYLLGERYLKKRNYITVTGSSAGTPSMPVPRSVQRLIFGICLTVTAFILLILIVILIGAFTRTWGVNYAFTLHHFQTALRASSESITNSLVLAVGGALAAAVFGTIAAYLYNRRPFRGVNVLDFASMLPYALPGVVMGLGFAVAFGGRIGFLVLTGTWVIIFLNHFVRRMPFAIRNASGALKQIDPALEEAASDLGAKPAYNFIRVTLPLLRASFLGAFVFGFINMMTDITAVIFLVSPRWRLLSIDLFNAIDAGRLGVAAALSTIMIATTFIVLALAWKLSGRGLDFFRK